MLSSPPQSTDESPSPPQRRKSDDAEGRFASTLAARPIDLQSRRRDVRFLIAAGSIFFTVMVAQYALLVLDSPEPIVWQRDKSAGTLKIDVNTAEWSEWSQLEHLRADLAIRVIAHRNTHGAFQSIDDLSRVEGIGETTLDRLRPLLTINHDSANEHERNYQAFELSSAAETTNQQP